MCDEFLISCLHLRSAGLLGCMIMPGSQLFIESISVMVVVVMEARACCSAHEDQRTDVEVIVLVETFLLPCGFQGLNSGRQAWW